jgi:hypothetical protein
MMKGVIRAGIDTQTAHKSWRKRGARIGRIAAPHGIDVHRRHLGAGDQQAGNDTGEVERADRGGDQAAPHDHQDRGRDDDGEHGGYRGDGDREGEVVAFLGLGIDEDLALARGIGRR